jgi:addiction module HigA family antidote
MTYQARRSPDRCPAHPGAILREDIIPAVNRSASEIAGLLGVSRQHLRAILSEQTPVTPTMAVRIGKLFGSEPYIWLLMQAAYDLWHVRQQVDVSDIRPLKLK